MTIKKVKTLDNIIETYGNKLPDNVVLAIFLEQANLPQAEVDFYIERYNEERRVCEVIENQLHGDDSLTLMAEGREAERQEERRINEALEKVTEFIHDVTEYQAVSPLAQAPLVVEEVGEENISVEIKEDDTIVVNI